MEYNALRLAKIHREVIETYYTPIEFAQRTYADYNGDIRAYIPCMFCDAHAELNHYIPPLEVFHTWVSEAKLELLAQRTWTLVPACRACSTLLNKSACTTLDDQREYIKASRNGTLSKIGRFEPRD